MSGEPIQFIINTPRQTRQVNTGGSRSEQNNEENEDEEEERSYIIRYDCSGYGTAYTTASSEEEARENFYNGDCDFGDEEVNDQNITEVEIDEE